MLQEPVDVSQAHMRGLPPQNIFSGERRAGCGWARARGCAAGGIVCIVVSESILRWPSSWMRQCRLDCIEYLIRFSSHISSGLRDPAVPLPPPPDPPMEARMQSLNEFCLLSEVPQASPALCLARYRLGVLLRPPGTLSSIVSRNRCYLRLLETYEKLLAFRARRRR